MKIRYLTFITINFIAALDCSIHFNRLNFLQNDSKVGSISGHYKIGALFPVRNKILNKRENHYECGNISEYGMQVVEAAFFALDLINRNKSILPNVTLGIEIEDYCDIIEVAQSKGKKLIDKSQSLSKCKETKEYFSFNESNETPLIGIIGPENRVFSKEVGNVLNFFDIVQIIYSEPFFQVSSDVDFFSVTPDRDYMIQALFDILATNNWTYVSLVYSDDLLEGLDLDYIKAMASNKGICIGDLVPYYVVTEWEEIITRDGNAEWFVSYIESHMPSLDKVNTIVCYGCSPQLTDELFTMIRLHSPKKFVVISGNGWPPKYPLERKQKNQDIAVGEILVGMEQVNIEEFDDYFLDFNLNRTKRNPWLADFWKDHFKANKALIAGYKQNPKIPYIIKSVFVFAHALHNMLEYGCGDVDAGKSSKKNDFNRTCFRNRVENVTFDFYGKSFEFEAFTQIPKTKKHIFYNFQRFENGSYDYIQVGEYIKGSDDEYAQPVVKLNNELMVYPENKTYFNSTCRVPCSENKTKVVIRDGCCWECLRCDSLEKLVIESARCENCQNGFESSPNKTSCIPMPTEHIKWHDSQTLLSILFSSMNIFLAMFTSYVFVKYKNTPVVKSSTKELCYIMLFGIIVANLTPFTILQSPNPIICVVVRILPPISFTFIYAALLIKTNRVARILAISQKKFPNLNPRFLSLRAQVAFTISLIIIEVLICSYSLFKYPIKIENAVLQKNGTYYTIEICSLTENMMLETFAFIAVLISICTYHAIKTRNLPENFNEAKYIGFAMYATILTDISFGLIYFESKVKILALNLCISVNTLIVLIFLFAPKLYIILRVPEKNTRSNFITTTNIRCFISNHPE